MFGPGSRYLWLFGFPIISIGAIGGIVFSLFLPSFGLARAQPRPPQPDFIDDDRDIPEGVHTEDDYVLVPLNPNGSETYFYDVGREFEEKGDWRNALRAFDAAIRRNPKFSAAFYGRGFAYTLKGDFDRAFADFDQAIRLDSRNAVAYFGRGDIYRRRGDLDKAFADFDQAIKIDSKLYQAYGDRGNIYYIRGDLNRALEDYNKVQQLNPNAAVAYVGLGNIYNDKNDLVRAFDYYSHALRLHQIDADAYVGLGNVYKKRGDFDNAIASYNAAIKLNPKLVLAYYNRSDAYQKKGLDKLAILSFDEAIRLQMNPKFNFYLPTNIDYSAFSSIRGFQFAVPPIPDLNKLKSCRNSAGWALGRVPLGQAEKERLERSKDAFYACMVDQAMPNEYRLTKECIEKNRGDFAAAAVCSTNRTDVITSYNRFKQMKMCFDRGDTSSQAMAVCVGQQFLGSNEQYYLSCIKRNAAYAGMAICALAKDLTPEQQIALSCVVESGGVVYAYAVCVGSQLTAREIEKCWDGGIATPEGCFGPNNEIRKFYNSVDEKMKEIFGENNEGYKIMHRLKENDLTPGPNHEAVKFINNGLNDINNGPGPNNEFVKAGNAISDGVNSIGRVLGF